MYHFIIIKIVSIKLTKYFKIILPAFLQSTTPDVTNLYTSITNRALSPFVFKTME